MKDIVARPALFLDRDGVVNREVDYLHRIEDFEFLPTVISTCKKFSDAGWLIFIITNQSGIARGFYSEDDYQQLTQWMVAEFGRNGVEINRVYHCPHHPDFSEDCNCRKPNPTMIIQATNDYAVDLEQSILVGDKESDISAAIAAGIKHPLLITTGHDIDVSSSRANEVIHQLSDLNKFL